MKFLSLKYKLLYCSIGISLVLTVFITIIGINNHINSYKTMLSEELGNFEKFHQKYLASKAWSLDYSSIRDVVQSKVEENWIDRLVVSDIRGDIIAQSGDPLTKNSLTGLFNLSYLHNEKEIFIGRVSYGGNVPGFYEMFQRRWLTIFLINGVFVVTIFLFSYILFYKYVLARLNDIVKFTSKESSNGSHIWEIYQPDETGKPDEISLLIDSFNDRARRIGDEFSKRIEAESRLKGKNQELTREINERKQFEAALKASEETFFAVLEGIDAMVYVSDLQSHEILFMNKCAKDVFGVDKIGSICWQVFRKSSEPCVFCTNEKLLDKQGNPTGVHVWSNMNPVTDRWYINHDRAIKWNDGRYVRLQIATDITDYKNMESELRQAHKMESIGTLTGGIAHDFNNILGIIIGNVELALDDTAELSPAYANIEEIKTASLRARDIVRQLLNYSRKTGQEQRPIDLAPVIRESLKLVRSSIPTSIEIRENIPETCTTVLADETQIHQVVINLCTNAVHSMVDGNGVIEIAVSNSSSVEAAAGMSGDKSYDNYLELTVRDDGSGIDPKIKEKMFDPYFTTKEVGKGTGMGLAVVHGIVKNHNGSIEVDSEPGRGTSFKICLPTIAVEPEQLPVATEKGKSGKGCGHILLVDDEHSIVDMTTQQLQKLGYTVEAKVDPLEALTLFEANPHKFDLLISDMTMPGMNGVVLSEKIKQIRPDMPIVICTGQSSLLDKKGAKAVGISAYATKPVAMAEMAEIVRSVLGG